MAEHESVNDTTATSRPTVNPANAWVGSALFPLLPLSFADLLLWAEEALDGRTLVDVVGCVPI